MLNKLNPKHYLAGAMVIGFFQIIDGITALNGYRSSITTAFSLLELVWFLVSLIAILAFQKQSFKVHVPVVYAAYYVFGWLYGSYLLAQIAESGPLELPRWYMYFATFFGCIYCLIAYLTYKKWFIESV